LTGEVRFAEDDGAAFFAIMGSNMMTYRMETGRMSDLPQGDVTGGNRGRGRAMAKMPKRDEVRVH